MNNIVDFATTYRVNNPDRPGCKMIVCGLCVEESEAVDALRCCGNHRCDKCGEPFGTPDAYDRADLLLTRLCDVAKRQREERLSKEQ